jgi:hypothetical protein
MSTVTKFPGTQISLGEAIDLLEHKCHLDNVWIARGMLERAITLDYVALYCRHSGTSDPWVKVEPSYYATCLHLTTHGDGEAWRIDPRGRIGLVACDYYMARADLLRFIRKLNAGHYDEHGYLLR